jgi:hypothetical protein
LDGLLLIAQARAAGLEVRADGERLVIRGPRVAEALALALRDRKPEIMALLSRGAAEVQWREAAFRQRIRPTGPIWPPRIRNTPLTDTPGHCSLCGDVLVPPLPRFPRCQPCVRALWLALNATREGQVAA